jgi:hypothetical protein
MPVLRESREIGYGILQTKAAEPPVDQVQMDLLAQTAFGTDAVKDHQLRIDRGAAGMAVVVGQMLAQSAQVNAGINAAQQMTRRHMIIRDRMSRTTAIAQSSVARIIAAPQYIYALCMFYQRCSIAWGFSTESD